MIELDIERNRVARAGSDRVDDRLQPVVRRGAEEGDRQMHELRFDPPKTRQVRKDARSLRGELDR